MIDLRKGDCKEVLKSLPDNSVDSIVHTCPVCGIVFHKKVYKNVQAVYCSQSCAYKGRSTGVTKRVVKIPYNIDRTPSEWRYKICEICGENYIANKRTQKYCCRKCFELSHKDRMMGDGNPAYINGSSYNKRCFRGNDWDTIRANVYKRDNYTCQKCGTKCVGKKTTNNNYNIIQCHHIEKYNGNNNTELNLITLCLKCHLEAHKYDKVNFRRLS